MAKASGKIRPVIAHLDDQPISSVRASLHYHSNDDICASQNWIVQIKRASYLAGLISEILFEKQHFAISKFRLHCNNNPKLLSWLNLPTNRLMACHKSLLAHKLTETSERLSCCHLFAFRPSFGRHVVKSNQTWLFDLHMDDN